MFGYRFCGSELCEKPEAETQHCDDRLTTMQGKLNPIYLPSSMVPVYTDPELLPVPFNMRELKNAVIRNMERIHIYLI
jgi:hypothetical protein